MTMSNLVTLLSQPALAIWLVKATALLVAALAATAVLRRASAGTRHLVWVGALAGILLLPALSFWTPVRLAILPTSLTHVVLPGEATGAEVHAPSERHIPAPATAATSAVPNHATPMSAMGSPAPAVALLLDEQHISLWATLLLAWGAASLVLLGWLGVGALSVRRIVASGRSLDDDRAWSSPLCEIADRLDLDAVPRLLASDRIEMPFACGVVHPTVVLPASAEGWNDSRRRAVLFHELAHVKRHDLVGHTLGRLACALYWFHPLVWTAARRLRAESERACDDLVLSCGARASDYADHLLDIVISVRRYGAPATAMPMARRRELEGRVLAILDPAVQRIGPGRLQSLGLVGTLGVLALCLAAMTPKRLERRATSIEQRITTVASTSAQPGVTAPSVAKPNEETRSAQHSRPMIVLERPAQSTAVTPSPAAEPASSPPPSSFLNGKPSSLEQSTSSALSSALGTITTVAVRAAASAIAGAASSITGAHQQGVDSAKVALLLRVLRSDQDASVRRMAAWGLSEAGDAPDVVAALADALRRDDDENVREMAAWALADSRRTTGRRALAEALRRDESDDVRETAAWALGNGQAEEERGALEAALTSDPSADVRESAAWGLGYAPQRPAAHAIVVALGDKSSDVRETAAWALAEIQDEDTAPAITEAFLRETNGDVRTAELRALTFLDVNDKEVLDAALASKDAELRARAVRMLAGAGAGAWPEPRPRPRPRPMP
jgi:beta-lactamase regulating signal transducer with metallopeptidase domain/HEAT repeat protein